MLIRLIYFSAVLAMSLHSVGLFAQATVREPAQPSDSASPQSVSPAQDINSTLLIQIQQLQQEVQSLRGLIEQQGYELRRLKQQRLDDYVDLDKRLVELTKQQAAYTSPTFTPQLPESPADAPVAESSDSQVQTTGVLANLGASSTQGKSLYDEAIGLLLDKNDYEGARTKFDEYIERFPGGQFTPNVYYWQGQLLYTDGKPEEARSTFEKLVDLYPAHPKSPDAKFKLARIYFEQGQKDEAKVLLDEVVASDTDAALLAKSFINKYY